MDQKKWNLAETPDLSSKVCIVTGGNSGLGYETVKALASKGAEVIMAIRSLEKGEAAKQKIQKELPDAKIRVYNLDLTNLKNIQAFATKFKGSYKRLDILINNAGIMMVPYNLTVDGFESQLGTNHLGHYALTGHLIDLLINTPKSRVVNVSSLAHKQGKMNFEDLMFSRGKGYGAIRAYSRSKLANLLFTFELQKYFESKGADALSVSAHPGVSDTNLASHLEKNILFKLLKPFFYMYGQSADRGALPQIRAAVDPEVNGNDFYGPGGKKQMSGDPVRVQPQSPNLTDGNAKKLWKASEKLTDVVYP